MELGYGDVINKGRNEHRGAQKLNSELGNRTHGKGGGSCTSETIVQKYPM
jgi:hypothetical protein